MIEGDLIVYGTEYLSDGQVITYIAGHKDIEFIPYEKKHKNNKDNGAFFKYINLTDIDLTRYGIYKNIDKENYNDTCLIDALRIALVSEERLEILKFKVKDRKIPKSDLEEIANIIKRKIIEIKYLKLFFRNYKSKQILFTFESCKGPHNLMIHKFF